MDTVLDETLTRLRVVDPYWQNVTRQDLAEMLHVYWRNAGKWRLVAEHEDPLYAAQAVIAWQDVVVEKVHAAVAQAQNALLIGDEWKAIADRVAQAKSQIAAQDQIRSQLLEWRTDLSAGRPGEALVESDRLQLRQLFDQTGPTQPTGPYQALLAQSYLADLSPRRIAEPGLPAGWIRLCRSLKIKSRFRRCPSGGVEALADGPGCALYRTPRITAWDFRRSCWFRRLAIESWNKKRCAPPGWRSWLGRRWD